MAVTGPVEGILGYVGVSTDTKPTVDVNPSSEFFETDTGKKYIFSGSAWSEDKEES
ncbi:MAG: hypothetical protein WC554_06635 [Clostridia bacterium]|jgi:hypothetical protein